MARQQRLLAMARLLRAVPQTRNSVAKHRSPYTPHFAFSTAQGGLNLAAVLVTPHLAAAAAPPPPRPRASTTRSEYVSGIPVDNERSHLYVRRSGSNSPIGERSYPPACSVFGSACDRGRVSV